MSDCKWADAPWILLGSTPEDGWDGFYVQGQPHPAMRGFSKVICTVDGYQSDEEAKANAHLIAAAPELAQSAEGLINFVMERYGLKSEDDLTCPHMRALATALRKAKGEP